MQTISIDSGRKAQHAEPQFPSPQGTIYAAGCGCFIRAAVAFCGIRSDLSIKRQHFWRTVTDTTGAVVPNAEVAITGPTGQTVILPAL